MIVKIIVLLFLVLCSTYDIKTKTIPLYFTLFILLIIAAINITLFHISILELIIPSTVGLGICLLSMFSSQSIGSGDGLIFVIIGLSTTLNNCLNILLIALIFSSIFSTIMIIFFKKDKHYTFAFVPFISVAYIIALLI